MTSALQVIRSQGPKFLRQLYRENVKPVAGAAFEFLGPEGLAAAALEPISVPMALAAELLLAPSELYEHADKPGGHPGARPRYKDFRPSNLPLSRNAGWADARAEVARQLNADREAAYEQAFEELMAKYPSPSVVIADPEINAERAAARRRLFSDEEALATLLGTRAEELMPQRFAAGGAVKRLAKRYFDPDQAVLPTTDIVKEPGGQWLAGSVERAVKPLKTGITDGGAELLRRGLITPEALAARPDVTLNRWLDQKLAKYIRNEMATERDPIRKLAEEGTLHFDPDWVPEVDRGEAYRLLGTDKPLRLGQSRLAQDWEDISDAAFAGQMRSAGEWTDPRVLGGYTVEKQLAENPWLAKVPPETPVYTTPYEEGLGFGHLVDELANALNPESGLPAHLLLDPEKLSKVNVADAVKRVSEINAWRAAQKVEIDALRARNPATHLVREYPEGYRWVELKAPDAVDLSSVRRDPMWQNPDEAFLTHQGRRQALEDALKYEGDIMGHCVGGYCDDVIGGRSRIFSLRDAKGEPHVTVEVAPVRFNDLPIAKRKSMLTERERALLPGDVYGESVYRDKLGEDRWSELNNLPPRIKQIKGKQNRAPNEEYLPFVQDFVRNSPLNGQWSDIGDLQNAGLTKHPTGKYVSDAEASALAQRHFGNVQMGNKPDDIENPWQYANRIRRYDPDMLSDTDKAFLADWEAGNFASGGLVRLPTATPEKLSKVNVADAVTQADLDDIMAAISKAGGQ